ncbi:MAG TPA: ATP-binding protein [Thermoanaerobaculia bacterium]|nr:ATP-binding protein [Thermoanaerobaculia bacterium]
MKLAELLLRYRKDPRFIISVPLVILAATSLVYYVLQQAQELSPDALNNRVLLFVLFNINLLLIIGILFVLMRGIVKLVLERQRGIIGSRFRTKLVVTYVAASLVPVIVLFVVATDFLRVSIDRWFVTPVGTILRNSESIAQMAQDQAADTAAGAAREIASHPDTRDAARIDAVLAHVRQFHGVDMVGVYRGGILLKAQANPRAPIHEVADPSLRFFEDVTRKGRAVKFDLVPSGKWIRTALPVRGGDEVAVAGVFMPAAMSQKIDESIIAYRSYQQLHSQRQTLKASQTMLFLSVTLAILFGTLWTSIYASRRITIPIKALAEATGRLAEGEVGHRVEVTATDEVGRLIDSFNDMSGQLAQQRRQLTETNRFMVTVLESAATGIIAFTDELELLSINRAALQMLHLEEPALSAVEGPERASLRELLRGELDPVADALAELTSGRARSREVALVVGGELRYLELSAARLGSGSGWVLAIEDSTQLVQAQKLAAWNEAARRIAHEIKNPLTPIQLSAERIAKKFGGEEPSIEEGCRIIVSEVSQLKRMVDEFSRFARMPAVHLRHAQLAEILQQAASLYRDVKPGVTIAVDVATDIELLMDPEQIRRAVGNLLKNAVEATESGEIRVSARRAPHRVVIEVADPGRGVPDRDKEKLFLPYFSTKSRGTGLGLAIVHRIVRDHDGQIHVHDNHPRGTRFEIELPA